MIFTPKIKKAVFPVAGLGTRFLPVTKAQPKEMLPIVDKPVIQYLVEEAVSSGIEEIIIVTGPGKNAIKDYFSFSAELEKILVKRGKKNLAREIRNIPKMAKFTYVVQSAPLGDGHAVLCAKKAIGREPFAVLFGDDLVDSRVPALKQLIKIYKKKHAPVIALQRIDKNSSKKYGIIEPEAVGGKGGAGRGIIGPAAAGGKSSESGIRLHKIKSLIEKPDPSRAPSNLAIIGKYILTPDVLDVLEHTEKGSDGEIRLIDAFRLLVRKKPLYGYEIEGKRYDTGDKIGFLQATIDYALKRQDIGPALKKHIRKIN